MKQKHYIAGLYYRLSQEDERQGESVSIDNQRAILRKYAEERGFEIHDEYIDDGVSGTTFQRPEVQRLLDDAKIGVINTIIVKDLSRFGRNYIEVGQYIDYVFPAFGIRFIAIQDNVDTENRDSNAMEMMPIMNIFNEWHAANTSKKIRAVKKAHAKEGIYTAKKAAYGYKIGADKRRTPVIDEETAPIVKRIFEMYASGMSPLKISETLNLEGVMSPAVYSHTVLGQKPRPYGIGLWLASTIRDMLNNIIYIGHMAQLRWTSLSYKNHKRFRKDESEWAVVYNNHEPIISQELWDKVHERKKSVAQGRKTKIGFTHPLSGFLFCADCGNKMKLCTSISRNGNRLYHFDCGHHIRYGKAYCFSHFISAKVIEEIILDDIREMAQRIVKKRPEKIAFIRGFKKGKFAFVYLTAVPLFCVGHMYAGRDFLASFFDAINQTVNLVILKYSTSSVTLLMADSAFFTATMYYCFFLVAINAVLFTVSLTGQRLWLFAQSVAMRFSAEERLIVFGTGRGCEAVYLSDDARVKALVGDFSHDEAEKLYSAKINYIRTKTPERVAERLVAACAERGKSSVVVIDTGDEERNIALCGAFIRLCDALGEKAAGLFGKLRVYVFGDPQYETTYGDITECSHGCIRYVNKYQKVAMNFVEKYPFALFMNEEQLDYSAAKVRAGVDINVAMIGFGKTNRQIFLTSVANNQFITEREGRTELKKVHYHIFDKNPAENNKNLNHSYYRYKQEREGYDADAYLPLPSLPADESYHKLDVNDTRFYNVLHDAFTSEKNSVNFAVIAFGSDLENIDFAQKLLDKRAEWGVKNLIVFVKTRKDHKDLAVLNAPGCYAIGNERECVFDIREIVGDSIYRMARLRNAVYDVEYLVTCGEVIKPTSDMVAKSKAASDREWYTVRSQLERESSLYCCLSVRSKLNLMGLDCVPKGTRGRRPLTEEEYLARYAKGYMPDFDTYGVEVDGKKVVHYDLDFKPSLRTDLAVHEHLRWNSFMISKGMVPADKERILNETVTRADGSVRHTNGKNYALRRHGNLTTFEGLEEFRKMVAERDGRREEEKDVIKYDYQLMDDAWWLLDKGGYIIVEKE